MSVGSDYADGLVASIKVLTGAGAPFEVVDQEIDGVTYPVFANMPANMKELFGLCSEHYEKDFIVYKDERYTLAECLEEARKLAWVLTTDFDIKKGDRVAIACRNYPEWCFAYLAITSIGGIMVALNAWWSEDELAYGLRDSAPKLIITDERRLRVLAEELQSQKIASLAVRTTMPLPLNSFAFEDLVKNPGQEGWPNVTVTPDDDATIFYTSGSTANPKGVLSTGRAIFTTLFTWAMTGTAAKLYDGTLEDEEEGQLGILMCLPLFHITGCLSLFMLSMLVGRKIVFMDKWNASHALKLIEAERLTHFVGVPTMSYEMLHDPDLGKYDLGSFLDIGAGGAGRPAQQVAELTDAFKVTASIGYGMTETNAIGCLNGRESYREKPGSTGRPSAPLSQIKIFRADGSECDTDEIGEITLKSAANMKCYWNNPEATAEALIDGWLMTGDLGYFDDDGFMYIVDRKKSIIICAGENISTLEVESALLSLDDVLQACVFALPDERLGEIVGAAVTVKNDRVTPETIKNQLDGAIAHFKIPVHIWPQLEKLPTIGTEKLDKKGLQQQYTDLLCKQA